MGMVANSHSGSAPWQAKGGGRSPKGPGGIARAALAGGICLWLAAAAAAQTVTALTITTQPATQLTTQPATRPATRPATVLVKPREANTGPSLVSNVFTDTDLRQALQDVASQAGVVIIPDPTVSGTVSCELKNVTVDKALDILLAGTGYFIKKTPDYYLVYMSDPKNAAFMQLSQTKLVKLDNIDAELAVKLLSPNFQKFAQAIPKGNMVLVTGPEEVLARLTADLALIDAPPAHVMLHARVVVLEQSDLLNLGLQWNFPQLQAGAFTDFEHLGPGSLLSPAVPWGVQLGYAPDKTFTNALLLTLNLLAQNEEATIISRPQIMAQEAREAEIKVITEEYFQIVTTGVYAATSTLEKIESGTVLKITPRIGMDGQITLDMSIEVSDVVARGQNNLPVVSRRSAKSTVRVNDGGTAAVAGLIDSRTDKIHQDVPGAAKLPLLGPLFQNKNDVKSCKQVAVFITASLAEPAPSPPRDQSPRRRIKPIDPQEFRKYLRESLQRQDAQH
jgi:type II secretory pathway component GspD/PulD (secretin)